MWVYHRIKYPKIRSRDTIRYSVIRVESRWRHAKGFHKITHRLTVFNLVWIIGIYLSNNPCWDLTMDFKQLEIIALLLDQAVLCFFVFFRSLDIDNCLLNQRSKSRHYLFPLRLLSAEDWMLFVHGCFALLRRTLNNFFLLFLYFSNCNTFIINAKNLVDQLMSH